MHTPKQRLVFYITGLIVVIHFALLGLHHTNLFKNTWVYVYPYFDQNWSLFAPPPQSSYYLLTCDPEKGNELKEYKRCVSEFPWPGNELLLNALNNSTHYTEMAVSSGGGIASVQMHSRLIEKLQEGKGAWGSYTVIHRHGPGRWLLIR